MSGTACIILGLEFTLSFRPLPPLPLPSDFGSALFPSGANGDFVLSLSGLRGDVDIKAPSLSDSNALDGMLPGLMDATPSLFFLRRGTSWKRGMDLTMPSRPGSTVQVLCVWDSDKSLNGLPLFWS